MASSSSRILLRVGRRAFATHSSSKAAFQSKLSAGPGLDDFIRGNQVDEEEDGDTIVLGNTTQPRLPSFLKTPIPTGSSYTKIKKDLRGLGLHTVCEEARCPNIGECWGGGSSSGLGESDLAAKRKATATIMLMGDTCTRGCRFCSVKTSRAPPPLDPHEPEHTAEAIKRWGLGYIVLTSVDRDDLADGGAAHFAETIMKIKHKAPDTNVEALTSDYAGNMDSVSLVARSGLDVYAHNIETVERMTPFVRDRRANFRQSLAVLRHAKAEGARITKTSIMLGVGEEELDILQTLEELRKSEVDVVTFGQYMRPTKRHMKVARYVTPDEFKRWKEVADRFGFLYVASGPLVRSSYKAGELFIDNVLRNKGAENRTKHAVAQAASTFLEPST